MPESPSPRSRSTNSLVDERLAAATAAIVDTHEAELRAMLRGDVPANQWRPEKYAEAVLAVLGDGASRDRRALEQLDGHVGQREQAIITQTLRPPAPADQQGAG